MRIVLTKGSTSDNVAIERDDGSRAGFDFPKKGPVPHDAFHFFVEHELGMAHGFWGLVASGMDPEAVGAMAAEAGHASAKRAQMPHDHIVELLQAERLVECFEAESWAGASDDEGIMAMAEPGWAASHVPPVDGVRAKLGSIRDGIAGFAANWHALPPKGSLTLEWKGNSNG
ncbi:hypothetical protein [Qipengyuania sp. RANM35]|uniref:hypothetical protein n=1 Tax=Qipengyuania sp. RANM35 TaxID=3068635 RepID=UPI0034DABF21